jgi:hypothetical protein
MKKQLALACALTFASTGAMASKARLISLGEDAEGSFYINDVRNAFLNPAALNDHKDTVTMEWGSIDETSATFNADNEPNTEAGIFHDAGKFVYGAYLGSRATKFTSDRSALTNYSAGTRKLQAADTLDLFIAGDAAIKWGASLTYSSTSDENAATESEQSLTVLKLGAMKNNWGGFFHYVVANESEDIKASEKFEMDSDITLGGHYDSGSYRYYGQYRTKEIKDSTETTILEIGATRTKNINDKVKLYTKTNLTKTDVKKADETMKVALTIGLEADVKSWLTLRGSVGQSLWDVTENSAGKEKTKANTTNVNTGATFKFGDLSVDGLIGTGDAAGAAGKSDSEKGVLSLDNLMTRVSLTYKY